MMVKKQEKKDEDSFKTSMMKKYADIPYLMNEISQNNLLKSSSNRVGTQLIAIAINCNFAITIVYCNLAV